MNGHGLLRPRVKGERMLDVRAVGIFIFFCSFSMRSKSPRLVVVITKALPYLPTDEGDGEPVCPEFEIRRYWNIIKKASGTALPCYDTAPQYGRFPRYLVHAGMKSKINIHFCFFQYISHLFVAHIH